MPDYSGYLTNVGLPSLIVDVAALKRDLMADGRSKQAALVQAAFDRFISDLRTISKQIAAYAEEQIKDHELSSQVRGSGGQGPSLTDFIGKSDPVYDVPGTVAINDEDYLHANGVGWWWTNEEGFSGHIGREIHGIFQPSGTFPQAGGGGDTSFIWTSKGGLGEIHEPIPDRFFVRDGVDDAKALWHSQIQQAEAALISACRQAVHPL